MSSVEQDIDEMKEEEESKYSIIDPAVFPDHILREDIDWCKFDKGSYDNKTWYKVKGIAKDTVKEHCGAYSFRCLKKDHPQQTKPIVLAAAKTYLTSGGYVVQIVSDYFASKETSPGVNTAQQNISQVCATRGWDKSFGWGYCKNGTVSLSNEWGKKLRITEELPFSLPTLPSGYKWLGDFPQFRVPVKGEYFMRYHSKTGFGDVVKCDGNFQVPPGEENRRLIVVASQPKESVVIKIEEMVEVSHLKNYVLQKDDVYVEWGKVYSTGELVAGPYPVKWFGSNVKLFATKKNYGDYVSKSSPKPDRSVTESHPEIGEGYREVDITKDIPTDGDQFWSKSSQSWKDRPANWGSYTPDIYRRKVSVKDTVQTASSKNSVVTEGPVIGAGYRKIDPKVDTPQEGDQFWNKHHNQWMDKPFHYGAFNHIDTYRRKVVTDDSGDYVILDPKIYGDYIPRAGDYFCKKGVAENWEAMEYISFHPIKHWEERGYVFRCKKENVPIVNTLPINNRADAAQISGVACATPPNKFQVQENEMNSPKSEETVKFETAKKLAVATAKLGGKMIWRTADYFLFAPIKKAASPFMWMVRYAVLGTMVGGGVYACTNPDDAKELLWKCVPKISISIDAPEVLG